MGKLTENDILNLMTWQIENLKSYLNQEKIGLKKSKTTEGKEIRRNNIEILTKVLADKN